MPPTTPALACCARPTSGSAIALTPLNERQRAVLNRFLGDFEGRLTARKWVALARGSMATAQRNIKDLVDRDLLLRNEGGRKNTSYTGAMS
jgi:Fic family protein